MCLISTQKEPFKAIKDIVAYKVVHKDKNTKELFPYFYRHFSYSINKIMIEENFQLFNNRGDVNAGFHSFIKKRSAIVFWMIHGSNRSNCKLKIIKVIIPKGSLYYEGTFKGSKNYCSNQLVIKG